MICLPSDYVFHAPQPMLSVLLVILYLCCRRKTKAVPFKSDITTQEEEVHKASPHIPHLKHEQAKVEHNMNIEMTPLPATNDSRGRVQLLALSCLQIVISPEDAFRS